MKLFSRFIGIWALRFMHNEWAELQEQLTTIYSLHQTDVKGKPSILMQQLLISGEDHRFFLHGGVDLFALCRAIWRCVLWRRWEGASTLEMQIVRVLTGRYERTIQRKMKEIALATLVTSAVPKESLPSIYLRIGYFGWRMNGFAEACTRLNFSAKEFTDIETAKLVARLKYPEPRSPSLYRKYQITYRAKYLLLLHASHNQTCLYHQLNSWRQNYEAI